MFSHVFHIKLVVSQWVMVLVQGSSSGSRSSSNSSSVEEEVSEEPRWLLLLLVNSLVGQAVMNPESQTTVTLTIDPALFLISSMNISLFLVLVGDFPPEISGFEGKSRLESRLFEPASSRIFLLFPMVFVRFLMVFVRFPMVLTSN